MSADDNADVVANRDTPIPVVSITSPDASHARPVSAPRTPSGEASKQHHFSASALKGKLESLGDGVVPGESPNHVSDRLFTMLLSTVLPSQDPDTDTDDSSSPFPRPPKAPKDRRSHTYVARPAFSLPTMSSNFRRFNARIGIAFVLQNRLIRLFTWRQPTQTLAFLAVYTFVCIDPTLLAVLPIACCLFFVMVPAFLARHPEPTPLEQVWEQHAADLGGPPLAGARTIRPAPELSKDFFRNMRDLQNAMEDFSRAHDAVIAFVTPLTNFSNEALSSLVYILLLGIGILLFLAAQLLPLRALALLAGYTLTFLNHPSLQSHLAAPAASSYVSDTTHAAKASLLTASKRDITLTPHRQTRQVEIFELQQRTPHDPTAPYEPHVFSPSPYAPLSPARVAGDRRPRGAAFFEDVLPPRGWRWADKKWSLDLVPREWVEDRCVTGVAVETEGERWVTDLEYEVLEEAGASRAGKSRKRAPGDGGGSQNLSEGEREVLRRAWEGGRPSRKGEWRRRRWVRGVERVPVGS